MAWTQTDLDNIERAMAQGTRKVVIEGKEVEYRSLEEMIKVRNLIKTSLGTTSVTKRRYATFSRGF
ncbi:MAG: hypothetical protein VX620_15460 [Pseudomonadota bacterium]|nr:hypothetical protein [Pseudomonadota bacterium]RCK20079.1 hypothetical protein TH8_19635 [Thalassospira profundimaris]